MAVAAVATISACAAQALDPPSISYTLDPGGQPTIYGGGTGNATIALGGGSAAVTSELLPTPFVVGHARSSELTSNPNGYSETSVSASLDYGYTASLFCAAGAACSATPFAPVTPVSVGGYAGAAVTGAGSFVSIQIGDAYGVSFYCFAGSSDCGVHSYAYAPSLTGTVTPGTAGSYTVDYTGDLLLSFEALANTRNTLADVAGDAQAYLDPKITFDPSIMAAGFTAGTITLSPGVGNSSASPGPGFGATIPEPGSWALLLAGFALTGIRLRRRERVGPA